MWQVLWALDQLQMGGDVCERLHQRLLPVLAQLPWEMANHALMDLFEWGIEPNAEQLGHLAPMCVKRLADMIVKSDSASDFVWLRIGEFNDLHVLQALGRLTDLAKSAKGRGEDTQDLVGMAQSVAELAGDREARRRGFTFTQVCDFFRFCAVLGLVLDWNALGQVVLQAVKRGSCRARPVSASEIARPVSASEIADLAHHLAMLEERSTASISDSDAGVEFLEGVQAWALSVAHDFEAGGVEKLVVALRRLVARVSPELMHQLQRRVRALGEDASFDHLDEKDIPPKVLTSTTSNIQRCSSLAQITRIFTTREFNFTHVRAALQKTVELWQASGEGFNGDAADLARGLVRRAGAVAQLGPLSSRLASNKEEEEHRRLDSSWLVGVLQYCDILGVVPEGEVVEQLLARAARLARSMDPSQVRERVH